MKKIVFLMLAAGVMMMVGCKKTEEGEGPSGGNGTDTAAVVKHNVELVYGGLPASQWQNISLDTIRKYNADETVDTIFMVPMNYNQFSTKGTAFLQGVVIEFRERHNVNPDKVFGKGELQLQQSSVENNLEIVRFFRDTLRYNVTMRYAK